MQPVQRWLKAVVIFSLLSALLLAACGEKLEGAIVSPADQTILKEEPFSVSGMLSKDPGKARPWLVVGSVSDSQYYPISSVTVNAQGDGPAAWAAQFYNGVCEEGFVPGSREVILVSVDTELLALIADSLALRQPINRVDLEEHFLASVVVDIQKPDAAFCAGAAPPTDQIPPGEAPPPAEPPAEGAAPEGSP